MRSGWDYLALGVITFVVLVWLAEIKGEVRQLRCDLVETEVTITTQLDSLQVKIDKPVWWR